MDERTNQNIRNTTEFIGFLLKFLSFISIVATVIATIHVARSDRSFGLQTGNNPLTWVVLASGLFATLVLFAFGTLLHMTCVIYDRQDRTFRTSAGYFKSPGRNGPTDPIDGLSRPTDPTPPTSAPELEPQENTGSTSIPSSSKANDVVTRPEATVPARPAKGKLWEQLTKERKLFGS
jgi:hypothetical protein